MIEKIRFVDHVLSLLETCDHCAGQSYRWYSEGIVFGEVFRLVCDKNIFGKKTITLTRDGINIRLTKDDEERLWKAHFKLDEVNEERMLAREEYRLKNQEAAEWWP